jgi:cobalt-zinc-cadmium efflux system outer membrane protein
LAFVLQQPRSTLRQLQVFLALGLLILITFSARDAVAADPSLDAFVAEVRARNPGLKARALERDSARREVSAAGFLPDPEVVIMLDRFPEHMGGEMPMVRYQLSQMLHWPGKLGLMEEAVARRADGKAALVLVREGELVYEAKRAYLMLALNAGLRQVNGASRALLTAIVDAALARYGAGTGGHHEVVRAEVERNALDVEQLDLDGDRTSTVAMMNALRNATADAPIPDPEPPVAEERRRTPPLVELVRIAEARRPELAVMRSMQREESTMARLARRDRYPDFMTSIWYNQMLGGPDTAGVMLGASIPLFSATRQTRLSEAADLRASSAGSDREAMRAMIRFEVADGHRRFDTSQRTLDLVVKVAAPRAEQSFSSSLSGYATGSLDIVGVLEAWRALQSVERARIEALVARAMAVAAIERAIAGPMPKESP